MLSVGWGFSPQEVICLPTFVPSDTFTRLPLQLITLPPPCFAVTRKPRNGTYTVSEKTTIYRCRCSDIKYECNICVDKCVVNKTADVKIGTCKVKVCSYIARYPVHRTAQSALHFTPWQTCSFQGHLNFFGKYSATLQLLREGYSFTYPPLSVLPGTHLYSWVNCGNVG